MGKLSYILGCVTRMDYPELFRTVGEGPQDYREELCGHLGRRGQVRPEIRRRL